MVFTFAGTIANFIDDDWNLVEQLIDFYHIQDDEHKGEAAAKAFMNSAKQCGGLNKILQKILSELFEADDPELIDYYEHNKHLPFHYNPDDDEENEEWVLDEDNDEDKGAPHEQTREGAQGAQAQSAAAAPADDDDDDLNEADLANLSAVNKLRLIVNKIVSSPQCRSRFRKIAQKLYKANNKDDGRRRKLNVVRDVTTRWNYTHTMITRALFLKDVTSQPL
ncbi:hypothetical protein EVJ58_g9262 [Rhodofomes roseus]|uniref:Uncharacterized protein n=1 Tax=Rhodofomes roseus TaxID=34475 RepID=A0A4Y9XUM7_9APHY|nr:hypothetical protein EVJ58_g9262 [Rhodofomes roseus]